MAKTVAFTFGRFNPPSTGHLRLIETLCRQNADDYFLYTSHSQDSVKNPLNYDEKLRFLNELFSFNHPKLIIVDSKAKTVIDVLQELTGRYDNAILVVGSDRVNDFKTLLEKYNGRPDREGRILYSFSTINVVSAGNRDPDSEDVDGMSASKLRHYASTGDFENFVKGIPTDNDALAREIYKAVRRGMNVTESASIKIKEDRAAARRRAAARARRQQHTKAKEDDEKEEKQLDELILKYFPNMQAKSDEAAALKQEYRKAKQSDQNLQPEAFFKAKAEEQKANDASENLYKEARQKQLRVFQVAAMAMKADGGLSKIKLPANSSANVLFLRSEPPTVQHSDAITAFLKSTKNTTYKVIAILEATLDEKNKQDAAVRALWTRDLTVPANEKPFIIFGKVDQLTRLLAQHFSTISCMGQKEILDKIYNIIQREWYAYKASMRNQLPGQRTLMRSPFPFVMDHPNLAVQALITTNKEKSSINDLRKRAKAQGISLFEVKRKMLQDAFLAQLGNTGPRSGDENYKIQIFYAFLEMFFIKTGRELGNIGEALRTLFTAEIEAAKELGSHLGITQIARAIKNANSAL